MGCGRGEAGGAAPFPSLPLGFKAAPGLDTEICIMLGMKTTLDLNDRLLTAAKALAAQQRTSLTRLIEEGLHLRLRAKAGAGGQQAVRLPLFKGRGGLVAGVDPSSNKALLRALDDDA